MSLIAICEAPGTTASTTTALALAALAPSDTPTIMLECDPSGGDVAGWAGLAGSPSWSSAVSGADRSWRGVHRHLQCLPSDLHVMVAPPAADRASTVVNHAAERFAPMLSELADVVAVADCGRTIGSNPWLEHSNLIVALIRQAASPGASLTRIDRTVDLCRNLTAASVPVMMAVVGRRPYDAIEIANAAGCPLLGVLPEDPTGAALAAGAWTVGRGASRSELAREARTLSARLVEIVQQSQLVAPQLDTESVLEVRS